MAASLWRVAALVPGCVRDLYRRSVTRGEAVGCGPPGGTWCGTEPRDRRRGARPHRQTAFADPRQRSGRPAPRSAEDPGRGRSPVSVSGAAVAATLAVAADHGGGHDLGSGGQGPDVRRRVRLDLGRCRAPLDLTAIAEQSTRPPLEDTLAGLDQRRPGGRRRRGPLSAGA